jgi:hypothetical protein
VLATRRCDVVVRVAVRSRDYISVGNHIFVGDHIVDVDWFRGVRGDITDPGQLGFVDGS